MIPSVTIPSPGAAVARKAGHPGTAQQNMGKHLPARDSGSCPKYMAVLCKTLAALREMPKLPRREDVKNTPSSLASGLAASGRLLQLCRLLSTFS